MTAIRNSSIPDLCHYARVSGFECLPHEQEQWPVPLYSTCLICKEKRRPYRGRRRRRYLAPATTPGVVEFEEGNSDTQADGYDWDHLKESYIWYWIPMPLASSFAAQSITGSDDFHFPDCEMYDDERSRASDNTSESTISRDSDPRVLEEEEKDVWVSNSDSLQEHGPTSTNHRSFIPVPVRRAREPAREGSRRMRSNIPVASSRVRREQRQISAEIDWETGSRIVGLDDFDWQHFDSVTF